MRFFCTYFDRNYLVKGVTMIRSLIQLHGDTVRVFVVCMDEFTRVILDSMNMPQVTLIPLHEIERGDEALLNARHERTTVEYLWTSTPTIILRVIERYPEIDILTYVDADMCFFNSTDPLYKELGDSSVMIHEHRFPAIFAHLSRYGIFNVGLLVFRRDERGRKVLRWWRDRCLEWCKATLEGDKFGDQKYLDVWPSLFQGVRVTKNIGIGVAPWNHSQYMFRHQDGSLYVDGTPLMVYHFHAFQILNELVIVPVGNSEYCNPLSFYQHAVVPYVAELQRSAHVIRDVYPEFTFGLTKNDFPLNNLMGFMVHSSGLPHMESAMQGLPRLSISSDWTLFPGERTL